MQHSTAPAPRAQQALRPRTNTVAGMEVVPTGAALGAEIHGVDLARPVPEALQAALRQAWHEHLVLLFRDQHLTAPQFLAGAGIFGPIQEGGKVKFEAAAGLAPPELPGLSYISNLDAQGHPTRENEGLGSLEVVWHSDNSYVAKPPAGSGLYSLEVPTHSGDTSFSNQVLAYDTLPEHLKAAIQGRLSVQDASRNSAGVLRPGVTKPTRPSEVPGPHHPLVRVHPMTGRRALYLGRRRVYPSQYIVGMDDGESEALLDRLWEHATRPELAWTHQWRVGDLLVWDNRAAMHRREEVDETQRRVMYRTQFLGEVPTPG